MLEFEGQVAKKFLNGIYVIQKYKSTNRYLYLVCHHVWSVKIEETISLFNLLLVISGPCWLLLLRHNRLITTKPKNIKLQSISVTKFHLYILQAVPLSRFSNNTVFWKARLILVFSFANLVLNHSSAYTVFCLRVFFSKSQKTV